MLFRFMSHSQFRVQTALSAHKGIQNHSLQFPAKLSIRKMKPWFELFKYSLWSAGWSHKLSTCCVNWGVTVENGQGSKKNRTATQRNQGMSKQSGRGRKAQCAAYHGKLYWWAHEGVVIDLFFLRSVCFHFWTWMGPHARLCRRNSIGAIKNPEVVIEVKHVIPSPETPNA